ncbi:Putative cytochrome P450 hydroxylase [Pseudomonas synxantha]|uniref:Cytochrome P450 hydroxylase n=1 Tax=Pseudomonas synxantha TaxID=47883 RepID=A0A3G7TYK7_9PSED|nr:cytochrome P450 [Pseudomonas synxantha]AZE52205.1 Putative cytochrome P450 hydroxylase [Pseudomonas synxantha]
MSDRQLRLGEELISPLHSLYDGLQVDGASRPVHLAPNHPVWLVTRYQDARTVLAHPGVRRDAKQAAELYTRRTGIRRAEIGESLSHHMLNCDPPDHARLQALVGRAFTRRHIERLQPHIERVTEELLDAIALREQADLMADFAVPLTIAVIFELLGIPEAERDHVRDSWERQAQLLLPEEANALADQQAMYLKKLLQAKREQPADDVYSGLVQAADETGKLTELELVGMAHLLLMSGFETTMNMIGNAMVTLLTHPEQLAQLRAQPDLLPNALEELVRHDSPVRASMLRFTVEDVVLGDVTIPKGEYILVSNLTANHDADRFENPDHLDLTRNTDGHLGYGFGVHYCVGAALARLEGRIAIGRLLSRFPNLALAVPHSELQWLPITFLRALISVPILPGPSITSTSPLKGIHDECQRDSHL